MCHRWYHLVVDTVLSPQAPKDDLEKRLCTPLGGGEFIVVSPRGPILYGLRRKRDSEATGGRKGRIRCSGAGIGYNDRSVNTGDTFDNRYYEQLRVKYQMNIACLVHTFEHICG